MSTSETSSDDSRASVVPIFRLAVPDDIAQINYLDSFSSSPTRNIHREMEKYFGSVDPSTHERTLVFFAELEQKPVAKVELMLPPQHEAAGSTGYIKRIIVHPDYRRYGLARKLLQYTIAYAHEELHLASLDLHVWEENLPALRLYTSLGFNLQHRELYLRLPL